MLDSSKIKIPSSNSRYYEYDWLRIIAVTAIIFYHVGLIFVNTGPLINSKAWILSNPENESKILQVSLIFIKQWSLSILFLISGIGINFALLRKSNSDVIEERIKRLLVPLFFGIIFLNPIQDFYIQKLNSESISLSLHNFADLFGEFNLGFHHLWFIAFLFIFSIAGLPFFNFVSSSKGVAIRTHLNKFLNNNFSVLFLVAPLVLYELYLHFVVPNTTVHRFNYNRITYIILFIYGYLLATVPKVNSFFYSSRNRNLLLGIVVAPLYYYLARYLEPNTSLATFVSISILKNLCCLVWMFASIGYSIKFLSFKNRFLAYLNEAAYPFYILHQVIILVIGYQVIQWPINYQFKFLIIFLGTLGGCLMLFLIIRKNMILRVVFGLKAQATSLKVQNKDVFAS